MKEVCVRNKACAFLLALVCLLGLMTGASAVEMSLLDWQTEENCVQGVQEVIRLFKASHPGVTIEVETADDTILLTTFKSRLYSGDAPDLVQGKPQNMQEFIDAGYILI